jgi:hypothetical protein
MLVRAMISNSFGESYASETKMRNCIEITMSKEKFHRNLVLASLRSNGIFAPEYTRLAEERSALRAKNAEDMQRGFAAWGATARHS